MHNTYADTDTDTDTYRFSFIFSLFASAVLYGASFSVQAELEPYLGGEIGAAYWDYQLLDDDISLSLSGNIGLDFNRYLGLELGYQNFGTMNFVAPSTEGELEAESFSAAAVVTLPISNRIQPFLLAGSERVKLDEQGSESPTFDTESENKSYFGIGVFLPQDPKNRSAIRVSLTSHDGGDIIRLAIGGKLKLRGLRQ